MGNSFRKDPADPHTGMSSREKKLVRDSWRTFCEKNPDYSVLLFMGMFSRHPGYQKLFEPFKNVHLQELPGNPKFRAHARAVGHQLWAIVESLDEPNVVVELIHKNAADHIKRAGVRPANFQGLFSAILDEMVAKSKSLMTPAVVAAWEKLFEAMNSITRSVYDEANTAISGSTSNRIPTPPSDEDRQPRAREASHVSVSAGRKHVNKEKPAALAKPEATTKSETTLNAEGPSGRASPPAIRSAVSTPERSRRSKSGLLRLSSTKSTKKTLTQRQN